VDLVCEFLNQDPRFGVSRERFAESEAVEDVEEVDGWGYVDGVEECEEVLDGVGC